MSSVTSIVGSALNSSHERVSGCATSPQTLKSHVARSTCGMSPAWRTGHFSVRYWPGGSRAGSYPSSITFFSALLLNIVPTLDKVSAQSLRAAARPRAFVSVIGPDAASYLERMLSNEVESLDLRGSCEALLLTPKARVIATVTVWRRGHDDFLLLTEPELGERLRAELQR